MGAVRGLLWVLGLLVLVLAGLLGGCSYDDGAWPGAAGGGETDPDADFTGGTLSETGPESVCPGTCTPEPQIPFNSKIHLVWIGNAAAVPDCPDIAPLQGFEGYVVSMTDMKGEPLPGEGLWVRECLISTDSEACDPGTTCAPLPPEGYKLCLSRENDGSCPADHYLQHVLADEWTLSAPSEPVTLCCADNEPH